MLETHLRTGTRPDFSYGDMGRVVLISSFAGNEVFYSNNHNITVNSIYYLILAAPLQLKLNCKP